ncbi:hypothetical protein TYRP_009917 [Tyrophagus putrescentiae]|nr:hypothetical protein TYRP_009917 [Tyrophagus putrescentiae]
MTTELQLAAEESRSMAEGANMKPVMWWSPRVKGAAAELDVSLRAVIPADRFRAAATFARLPYIGGGGAAAAALHLMANGFQVRAHQPVKLPSQLHQTGIGFDVLNERLQQFRIELVDALKVGRRLGRCSVRIGVFCSL